jgi:lipoprotein signal peptidase
MRLVPYTVIYTYRDQKSRPLITKGDYTHTSENKPAAFGIVETHVDWRQTHTIMIMMWSYVSAWIDSHESQSCVEFIREPITEIGHGSGASIFDFGPIIGNRFFF